MANNRNRPQQNRRNYQDERNSREFYPRQQQEAGYESEHRRSPSGYFPQNQRGPEGAPYEASDRNYDQFGYGQERNFEQRAHFHNPRGYEESTPRRNRDHAGEDRGYASYMNNYRGAQESRQHTYPEDTGYLRGRDYGAYEDHGAEHRNGMHRAGSSQPGYPGAKENGQYKGRGPKGYHRSDDRIREDINDRLSDDSYVDASEVEVQVESGEVTLSGSVSDRQAKRRAEDIAESVSGVSNVENRIRTGAAQQTNEEAPRSETNTASGQNKKR